MTDTRSYFEKWFKQPLLRLQADPDAGFATVMISLALLERYLREKSGLGESPQTNASFRSELMKIFPTLSSDTLAQRFWAVCRHGLMHQATFKTTFNGSVAMRLHDSAPEIEHSYDSVGDVFVISPTKFSNRVIEIIESDFRTFEAPSSPGHPLSKVSSSAGYSGYSGR